MSKPHENEVAKQIVDACFKIHTKLGPGLFESVHERILIHELNKRGLNTKAQVGIPLTWEGLPLELGYRADVIVNNCVIVEIKSVEGISKMHKMQLLTYLKWSEMRSGILVNFNEALIKNGIKRVVNNL